GSAWSDNPAPMPCPKARPSPPARTPGPGYATTLPPIFFARQLSIATPAASASRPGWAAILRLSRRSEPVTVLGEAEQPLHAVIARRARLRDAPMIRATGRELPVVRPARQVAVVDLQHVGGVFDRYLVRPTEIGEHVVARSVPPGPPLHRIAVVLH